MLMIYLQPYKQLHQLCKTSIWLGQCSRLIHTLVTPMLRLQCGNIAMLEQVSYVFITCARPCLLQCSQTWSPNTASAVHSTVFVFRT